MNKKEDLQKRWKNYEQETSFNSSVFADFLTLHGQKIKCKPGDILVEGGDFPSNIYFITEGIGIGKRSYEDGDEYVYFQVDQTNGNIGLLEVLARKESYISTVTCLTDVVAIKIPSHLIYEKIMRSQSLLRRCSVLLAQDLYRRSGSEGLLYRFKGVDRMRYFLIKYYEENCDSHSIVKLQKKYQDISFELGISLRTVGRSIKKLKEQGEIISNNRKIFIDKSHYQILMHQLNSH
ncbi:Crp/Fnr family transcriptional regulator [Tetragenococcus solitarius]|uniref:Cyclic nucleotide-binding domain-containing protein n=1 Tax=Tetragenococcus solitarius TaxID=71453 RepID=A0ABP6KN20_9ENTE|nr:Crp/Fnr family transcriptional regulator [Tetragenococcus solitarius]